VINIYQDNELKPFDQPKDGRTDRPTLANQYVPSSSKRGGGHNKTIETIEPAPLTKRNQHLTYCTRKQQQNGEAI